MIRAWPLMTAVTFLFWATPDSAAAFCRATTVDEPEARCGQVGEPLWWPTPCLSYAVDEDGSQWLDPAQTRAAVDAGFMQWATVTCAAGPANVQFRRLADSTCMTPEDNSSGGNVNTVAFLDPWIHPSEGSALDSRALGFTSVWFDTETGEIWGADMLINDERQLAHCATNTPCTSFDLESIATHEAGHFLGIGHSPLEDATMYAISGPPGDIEMRTLEQDDIDAICTIYPPSSEQSECREADFTTRGGLDLNCEDDPTGGGGCSAAIGGPARHTWSWVLLGFLLLMWSDGRRRSGG